MIPIKTESHAVTDVGVKRNVNQDRYLAADAASLWAVADGMGGMARGEWAAAQVIEALAAIERRADLEEMLAETEAALQQANRRILAEAEGNGETMGTTAVVLVVRDRRFGIVWVGDSRAYLLRGGTLYRLTRDHSQVQELVDRGLLKPAAAPSHPLRNVLTRAVGVAGELQVERLIETLEPDDLLMLCSDGLYGVIGEAEMEASLREDEIRTAARKMIGRCHELGAPDNITLVAVKAAEITLMRLGGGGGD